MISTLMLGNRYQMGDHLHHHAHPMRILDCIFNPLLFALGAMLLYLIQLRSSSLKWFPVSQSLLQAGESQ